MKLTVIGYYGGSPLASSACSSYLLNVSGKQILLDCGPGALSKLQENFSLNDIDDVLITHFHYDHYSDLGGFVYNRLVRQAIGEVENRLHIYAQNDETILKSLQMEPATEVTIIDEDSDINIHGVRFTFLVTEHPVKCLAVRAEYDGKVLVYTADSAYFDELVDFSKDADLLIVENSLYSGFDGSKSGHMNTEDVIRLVNKSGAKKVILTHLPIYGDHQKLLEPVREAVEAEVFLAEDFLEIEV